LDKEMQVQMSQKYFPMSKPFDIVIAGATGFTGTKVCLYLAKNPPVPNLKWGILGRSADKLQALKELLESQGGSMPAAVEIADVNKDNLDPIMAKYKVCISCVGPFRFYGQPVVKSCVSSRTDYVDICGETEFIESMHAEYFQQAEQNNVAVVSACGYDSIPADLGNLFAKREFEKAGGVCASTEMFVILKSGPSGFTGNATTFTAAVHSFKKLIITKIA
jgi:short subunit dehydrogenase-like uncharacterized protein